MALDKNLAGKKSGDAIIADDWNKLAAETIRLDAEKLDTVKGGAVAGLLTAAAGLTAPALRSDSLGINLLTPADTKWDFQTTSSAGFAVITGYLDFAVPTSVLILGHGHGNTSVDDVAKRALSIEIRVDGSKTNPIREGNWGVGYLNPPINTWTPMIAVGSANLPKGTHKFELALVAVTNGTTVKLNGPSLWVARLGTW